MTYFMRLPEEGALPVPVLVVEDEPLLQRRIKAILGSLGYTDSLVFAGSLAQARACLAAQPPRLALVDVQLPDGSGLELIREIRAGDADVGILVVSAWGTHESILGALRAGATGYVLKERDDVEVSLSIRSVLRGGAPIDPFIARQLLRELPEAAPGAGAPDAGTPQEGGPALDGRERQILRLVGDGLSNREIAEQVLLSRGMVEGVIRAIYRKLAVSTRVGAVRTAQARGLLD
jgi:DNA-binding NarL/FixJ family response regulator